MAMDIWNTAIYLYNQVFEDHCREPAMEQIQTLSNMESQLLINISNMWIKSVVSAFCMCSWGQVEVHTKWGDDVVVKGLPPRTKHTETHKFIDHSCKVLEAFHAEIFYQCKFSIDPGEKPAEIPRSRFLLSSRAGVKQTQDPHSWAEGLTWVQRQLHHPLAETPNDNSKLFWSALDWNWPIPCTEWQQHPGATAHPARTKTVTQRQLKLLSFKKKPLKWATKYFGRKEAGNDLFSKFKQNITPSSLI